MTDTDWLTGSSRPCGSPSLAIALEMHFACFAWDEFCALEMNFACFGCL
jgi:hypothetical protein